MLATPGRSPRLLPPLPSPRSGGASILRHGDAGGSMGPPPPKRPRQRDVELLDEDTYVEAIEHIVQRDYFPDIPRLQDRLEWIEAIRTGDPEHIRMAQLRIAQRRATRDSSFQQTVTPRATPRSAAGTPYSILTRSPFSVGAGATPTATGDGSAASIDGEGKREKVDMNMSLDEFLQRHTSEDNASFSVLNEKDNKKRLAKAQHLLMLENGGTSPARAGASSRALIAAGSVSQGDQNGDNLAREDRKTDGYGSTGQPVSTLVAWPYTAKNSLMYDASTREDAPLTEREAEERAMGPPKQVVRGNTRFTRGSKEGSRDSMPASPAILYTPVPGATPQPYVDPTGVRGSRKHYDLEDLRGTPRGKEGAAGVPGVGPDGVPAVYEYVSTPSFTPGEGPEASPFVTWGQIDSTPLRLLDADEDLGLLPGDGGRGSGDGPQFKIPPAPARDEAAQNMSRTAARSLKQRQLTQQGGTPSGGAAAGTPAMRPAVSPYMSSPGAARLSAAAQRLVSRSAHGSASGRGAGGAGVSGNFDATLRASYATGASPSSRRRALSRGPVGTPGRSGAPSPAMSTPSGFRGERGEAKSGVLGCTEPSPAKAVS